MATVFDIERNTERLAEVDDHVARTSVTLGRLAGQEASEDRTKLRIDWITIPGQVDGEDPGHQLAIRSSGEWMGASQQLESD